MRIQHLPFLVLGAFGGCLMLAGCAGAPRRGPAASLLSQERSTPSHTADRGERGGASLRRAADAPVEEDVEVSLALQGAARATAKRDFIEAQRVLSAALATHEASIPLLNQLALAYLYQAGARSGHGDSNTATVELARQVCLRALAVEPSSAPVHNTLGLVLVRLRSYGDALAAFDQARSVDPSLFEAHFNAGALRIRTYAFASAERAYRDALRVRKGDYDATVGLALAIRAQIDGDPSSFEARFREANEALEGAILASPERPEAYLNQALLLLAVANALGMQSGPPAIVKAQERLRAIGALPGATRELTRAKEVAKAVLEDLKDALTCDFRVTERERKERFERWQRQAATDYLNADTGVLP